MISVPLQGLQAQVVKSPGPGLLVHPEGFELPTMIRRPIRGPIESGVLEPFLSFERGKVVADPARTRLGAGRYGELAICVRSE